MDFVDYPNLEQRFAQESKIYNDNRLMNKAMRENAEWPPDDKV